MRLKNELDAAPFSIWFTLTYNNKYLPTLVYLDEFRTYVSGHRYNIRFNSKEDVLRKDDIVISSLLPLSGLRPENYPYQGNYIGYSSKSDFQLFLKNLRKDINNQFPNYENKSIRYYAISEYGPTTKRPHIHALLFLSSYEVSLFCKEYALYKNWKMCDKTRFDQYTKFATAGVSGYVTNYITGFSDLHPFLKNPDIKPFRLASKAKAIGSDSFDEEEFFEKIVSGDLQYYKRIERLESVAVCCYPKNFESSLFPKCYKYSELSFGRLLEVYGFLFTNVRERGIPFLAVRRRLSAFQHSADVNAARKCYQICLKYGFSVFHYVYLLDMLYYKIAMSSLAHQYNFQYSFQLFTNMLLYENFIERCQQFLSFPDDEVNSSTLHFFLEGFGLSLSDISHAFIDKCKSFQEDFKQLYIKELENVKQECVKVPKANEVLGTAPHNY